MRRPLQPAGTSASILNPARATRAPGRSGAHAPASTARLTPPVIETERLSMGPVRDADVEAFIKFCATGRSRFIGGPSGRADAWRSVAVHAGQWVLRGFGTWWLTDRDTGQPAGRVGLWQPDGLPEPELTWVLYVGYEGKGLAAEAAIAARDWAYDTLGRTTLTSLIDAENTRSIRLAERLGARPDGTWTPEHGGAVMIWRHPGPEALA